MNKIKYKKQFSTNDNKDISARYNHDGYVMLHFSDGTRKLEHRWIVEQILGRELGYDELVHHHNDDKSFNGLCNLRLKSREEHATLHKKEPFEETHEQLVCGYCGEFFWIRKVYLRCSKGRTNKYCSRSCGTKAQWTRMNPLVNRKKN